MIDEASKRRAEWVEGEWVELEGGVKFSLPKPRVEYRIKNAGGMERATPAAETSRRFGDRFWKLRDELSESYDSEDAAAIYSAWGNMGSDLILRNYDLTPDEVADLLPVIELDESNQAMWGAISRLTMGIGPKPNAVG